MSDTDFDTVVVGAGAIGLAAAAALAQRGQTVLVIEAADRAGDGTTSRNSEVIHAGLYYPTGSLKHRFCVAGRRQLYAFLDRTGVAFRKCGKLVVATDTPEEERLSEITARAAENGVEGLRVLSASECRTIEPDVAATAALWSSETGIFDTHGYLAALRAILEDHGGTLVLRTPMVRAEAVAPGFRVHTGGADPAFVTARGLVNAGGLMAAGLARVIEGMPPEAIPEQRLAKGNYFRLSGRAPFSRLIYPVPVEGGLGVHATLDLGGGVRFGPDVEWLPAGTDPDDIDYTVPPGRADAFAQAIRRYWPGLAPDRLVPDYSGVRPKLAGPGKGFRDFDLQTEDRHGVPGLINLFGIESPGLTASLAIAEAVAQTLDA